MLQTTGKTGLARNAFDAYGNFDSDMHHDSRKLLRTHARIRYVILRTLARMLPSSRLTCAFRTAL